MRALRWSLVTGLVGVAAGLVGFRHDAPAQPAPAEWKLVWSDEFDEQNIDRTKWDFDSGNGINGWGNGELQYYTGEPKNAFVKDGMLHVRVLKESYRSFGYTSSRLKTRKKDGSPLFCQRYGRFEFRAKLPTGRGIWPALWMMPQDNKYGGWPSSGEIDIMEARGQDPTRILGTLHFGSRGPAHAHASREYVLPRGGSIADFHVYVLEWTPGRIRWLVDDQPYATQSFWWSSSRTRADQGARSAKQADLYPWPAPFDQPFYLIMNVAVGGNFLGNPDRTTRFPAEMLVDYVRVYEKVSGYGATPPRGEGKLPFAGAP